MSYSENLQAWETLLIAAQTGSVSQTGLILDMDTAKVSRFLSGLEKELGVSLFDKSRRPFRPTGDCLRFLSVVEPMVQNYRQIQSLAKGKDTKTTFRIAAPIEAAQDFYSDQWVRYTNKCPNIQFEHNPDASAALVLSGEVDIAMVNQYPTDTTNLVVRPTHTVSTYAFATPQYLQKNGVPLCPEDLAMHTGLLQKTSYHPLTEFLYNDGNVSCHLQWKKTFYSHDQKTIKRQLLEHQGMSVDLFVGHVIDELQAGQIIPILTDWQRIPWNMCIVTRLDKELANSELRNFAKWWQDTEIMAAAERSVRCKAALATALENAPRLLKAR